MEFKPYDFLSVQLTEEEISKLAPFDLERCLKGEFAITRAGHPAIIFHHEIELMSEEEPRLIGYLLTKQTPHRVIEARRWFEDGSFTHNRSIKGDGDLVGMRPKIIEPVPLKLDELVDGQTYWVVVDQEIIQCTFGGQPEFFSNHLCFQTKKEAESYVHQYFN